MKKIVLVMVLMLSVLVASASETLYFTYNQSIRAVTLLNNEDELMIYCGYEDELPTYCLVNEVWAEQISSSFYEIWMHGYDAYTGEEIYMPIDMECIWLLRSGHIISAAQTLRFRNSHARPTFVWQMPPYNPWVRGPRPHGYYYTYHYDIHRPGWSWRHPHPGHHYHPYYCRPLSHPAPLPHAPFTPGKDVLGYKVTKNGANGEVGYEYLGTTNTSADRITASRSATVVKNDPSSRSGNRITSNRSSNTVTTTDRISGHSTSTTAPTINEGRGSSTSGRSTSTSQSTGRSSSPATPSSSSRSTSTSQSTGRSSSSATPSSSSRSTSTSQSTGRSSSSATPSSSSRSTSTSQSTGRSSSSATPNSSSRSTSTSQSTGRSSSSATPSSSSRSTSTTSRGTSTRTR